MDKPRNAQTTNFPRRKKSIIKFTPDITKHLPQPSPGMFLPTYTPIPAGPLCARNTQRNTFPLMQARLY